MGTRLIRVDDDVYAVVLATRHKLEAATGRTVSMGGAVAFLAALTQVGVAKAPKPKKEAATA